MPLRDGQSPGDRDQAVSPYRASLIRSGRHHHPARVAGLRAKTRLQTRTHKRPRMGQTNREYAPSGAQSPPLTHVVPPSTPSTTTATPAPNSLFEISPARHSPNDPDMISIARGNDVNTTSAHMTSFSPDESD